MSVMNKVQLLSTEIRRTYVIRAPKGKVFCPVNAQGERLEDVFCSRTSDALTFKLDNFIIEYSTDSEITYNAQDFEDGQMQNLLQKFTIDDPAPYYQITTGSVNDSFRYGREADAFEVVVRYFQSGKLSNNELGVLTEVDCVTYEEPVYVDTVGALFCAGLMEESEALRHLGKDHIANLKERPYFKEFEGCGG